MIDVLLVVALVANLAFYVKIICWMRDANNEENPCNESGK